LPALGRAAPFLRGQVAKAMRLRHAPDLHFAPDTSLDSAMHMDALLRSAPVRRDLG
jgi:ribosome-binding factor A